MAHFDYSTKEGVCPRSIKFNPSGSILAIGSNKIAPIYLYEVKNNFSVSNLIGSENFTLVDFSHDGNLIASGGPIIGNNTVVRIWNTKTKKILKSFYVSAPISSLSFSCNSLHLASGLYDGKIYLWCLGKDQKKSFWDLFSSKEKEPIDILNWFDKPVVALAFSPQKDYLVGLDNGGSVKYGSWKNSSTFETIYKFSENNILGSASFTPDGENIILSSMIRGIGKVILFNLKTNKTMIIGSGSHTAISHDGRILAFSNYKERRITVYDLVKECTITINRNAYPSGVIDCIALSPSAELLVTGADTSISNDSDAIKIWQIPVDV